METVSPSFESSIKRDSLEDKNMLILPKHAYLLISISSLVLSSLLYYLGSEKNPIGRFSFAILGPLLTFMIFVSLVLYLGFDCFSTHLGIRKIIGFLLVAGVSSTLIALTLNTRGQYAIIFTYLKINKNAGLEEVSFILSVIMAPLIEETMKNIPLFILMRGFYQSWGGVSKRILNDSRMTALAGVLIAGMFTMLETYFYILDTINYESIQDEEVWSANYLQIIIRSTSPIHYLTVAVVSFSIFLTLYNSRNRTLGFTEMIPVFVAFLVALVIHGTWNFVALQLSESTPTYFNFYPVPLFYLGMIALLALLGIIIYSSKLISEECSFCGLNHAPPFDVPSHFEPTSYLKVPSINQLLWKRSAKKFFSDNLGVERPIAKIFVCTHCSYPVPVYSIKCWFCGYRLEPPYSQVFQFRRNLWDNLSIGLTLILATTYLVNTLIALVSVFRNGYSDENGLVILVLTFLGISYLWGSYWALNPRTKPLGIILSRFLTGAFFIQLIFLMQIISILISDNLGIFTVTSFNLIMVFLALGLIIGYEPIIDGGIVYV